MYIYDYILWWYLKLKYKQKSGVLFLHFMYIKKKYKVSTVWSNFKQKDPVRSLSYVCTACIWCTLKKKLQNAKNGRIVHKKVQ